MNTNMNTEVEKKEVKKKNKLVIVLFVILVLIIIGLVGYIAYDKLVLNDNVTINKKDNKEKSKEKETAKEKIESNKEENYEVKELDLAKCINNPTYTYQNAVEATSSIGLTPVVDSSGTSVTIKVDGSKFGPVSTLSAYYAGEYEMYVDGFDKKIKKAYVGEFGHDSVGTTLLFVMEDETVTYTHIFKKNIANAGNIYYSLNTYQQGENNFRFKVDGTVNGVSGIVNIYNVDRSAPMSSGARTAIAAKKDGSFYDLTGLV